MTAPVASALISIVDAGLPGSAKPVADAASDAFGAILSALVGTQASIAPENSETATPVAQLPMPPPPNVAQWTAQLESEPAPDVANDGAAAPDGPLPAKNLPWAPEAAFLKEAELPKEETRATERPDDAPQSAQTDALPLPGGPVPVAAQVYAAASEGHAGTNSIEAVLEAAPDEAANTAAQATAAMLDVAQSAIRSTAASAASVVPLAEISEAARPPDIAQAQPGAASVKTAEKISPRPEMGVESIKLARKIPAPGPAPVAPRVTDAAGDSGKSEDKSPESPAATNDDVSPAQGAEKISPRPEMRAESIKPTREIPAPGPAPVAPRVTDAAGGSGKSEDKSPESLPAANDDVSPAPGNAVRAAPPQQPASEAPFAPAPNAPQANVAFTLSHNAVFDAAPREAGQPVKLGFASAGSTNEPAGMDALALRIATHSVGGERKFSIRLDPPELGRIEVNLTMNAEGDAGAELRVDKPQTLELLQKDASALERALKDAGLNLSGGLAFSLKGDGKPGGWRDAQSFARGRNLQIAGIDAAHANAGFTDGVALAAQAYGFATARLDIRV